MEMNFKKIKKNLYCHGSKYTNNFMELFLTLKENLCQYWIIKSLQSKNMYIYCVNVVD